MTIMIIMSKEGRIEASRLSFCTSSTFRMMPFVAAFSWATSIKVDILGTLALMMVPSFSVATTVP